MTTIELRPDQATIRCSPAELHVINNALNEVCNALLHVNEFSTRMGAEREEAARLLEQVHALITRMEAM
jgi:hypothetical protein